MINNKSALRDGCQTYLCSSIKFLSQTQLSSLFRRIERRSNFHPPLSGCGVDVGPVGAASLRQLPLYKQVCFQLAVFRVGSPLGPMKDVDAVSGRLLAALLWVHEQPGLEQASGVLKCAPSLTGSFKDGEILFNW